MWKIQKDGGRASFSIGAQTRNVDGEMSFIFGFSAFCAHHTSSHFRDLLLGLRLNYPC